MISQLLPLTKNKLNILKEMYETEETYLLELSKKMKIHPFSLKKTLDTLKPFMNEKKAGKTIRIFINKDPSTYNLISLIIEDYKKDIAGKETKTIIKNIENIISYSNIKSIILFGSYAKNSFNENSDIDLLLIVEKKEGDLKKRISQFSSVMSKEVSPLIFSEKELIAGVSENEPALSSLKKPSQRLIIKGAETFLDIIEQRRK